MLRARTELEKGLAVEYCPVLPKKQVETTVNPIVQKAYTASMPNGVPENTTSQTTEATTNPDKEPEIEEVD